MKRLPRSATPASIRRFRATVYRHFRIYGRSFPWRETRDPYAVLVSEVMLQQTQVERVAVRFTQFIGRFPTVRSLAAASFSDVLALWSGLGYNRRALYLHRAAKTVVRAYGGTVPADADALSSLSGIGPYTAAAVEAFACNRPVRVLETNIRAALLHHFFPASDRVDDARLLPVLDAVLDRRNPRRWYSALMDYGAFLKRTVPNPSRRSSMHYIQPRFEGSTRQLRGRIVSALVGGRRQTIGELSRRTKRSHAEVIRCIDKLEKEGLVTRFGKYATIAADT